MAKIITAREQFEARLNTFGLLDEWESDGANKAAIETDDEIIVFHGVPEDDTYYEYRHPNFEKLRENEKFVMQCLAYFADYGNDPEKLCLSIIKWGILKSGECPLYPLDLFATGDDVCTYTEEFKDKIDLSEYPATIDCNLPEEEKKRLIIPILKDISYLAKGKEFLEFRDYLVNYRIECDYAVDLGETDGYGKEFLEFKFGPIWCIIRKPQKDDDELKCLEGGIETGKDSWDKHTFDYRRYKDFIVTERKQNTTLRLEDIDNRPEKKKIYIVYDIQNDNGEGFDFLDSIHIFIKKDDAINYYFKKAKQYEDDVNGYNKANPEKEVKISTGKAPSEATEKDFKDKNVFIVSDDGMNFERKLYLITKEEYRQ